MAPHVYEFRCKAQTARKRGQKLSSLTFDEEEQICLSILNEASPGNFVSQNELRRFIEQKFNKTLLDNRINGFLEWRVAQFK
jgi:hypothetical protein